MRHEVHRDHPAFEQGKLPTHIIPANARIKVYSVTNPSFTIWVTTVLNVYTTKLPGKTVCRLAAFELRENLPVSHFVAEIGESREWLKHEGDRIGCLSKSAKKIPEKTKKR